MINELFDNFFFPICTNAVAHMPYPCLNNEECAPYKLVLFPGQYKVELWGASGGDTKSVASQNLIHGGLGGYVSADLNINETLAVYFYIGAKGNNKTTKAYNGGGSSGGMIPEHGAGAGGGGATDVRLSPSTSNPEQSLLDRFMVAGAGGGSCAYQNGAVGGSNLGLIGEEGNLAIYSSYSGFAPKGGNQISGGKGFTASSGSSEYEDGSLGQGGGIPKSKSIGPGGGGGGYFGGGSGGYAYNVVSSGAAGSSFVNGYSNSPVAGLPQPTNVQMIGGKSLMPSPQGEFETGHYGNGFARVTVIKGGFVFPRSFEKRRCLNPCLLASMLISIAL